MKKLVLIKSNNTKIKASALNTYMFNQPVIGERLVLVGMDSESKSFKTSPVLDFENSSFFMGLGSTLKVKTKNSEYVFRVFGS